MVSNILLYSVQLRHSLKVTPLYDNVNGPFFFIVGALLSSTVFYAIQSHETSLIVQLAKCIYLIF